MNSLNQGPAERVYYQLRKDVVRQRFSLGERLMINSLAEQYFVSSTPIREALSRLYGEQLIDFRYGHGYFCKIPSLSEVKNLYSLLRVVLVASAAKVDGDALRELSFRVVLKDALPPDGGKIGGKADISVRKSVYVEKIFDCVSGLGGNAATLAVVRNLLARTHFILDAAFMDEGRAQALNGVVDAVEGAVAAGDSADFKKNLNLYFDMMEAALPDLLRDLVASRFLDVR